MAFAFEKLIVDQKSVTFADHVSMRPFLVRVAPTGAS
jgi:hypothetical protein